MPFRARSDRSTIFQPQFVAGLFDEMAATYGAVNVLSSFGFCVLWRKKCIGHVRDWPANAAVADWMSGMGELWPDLCRRADPSSVVTAVDISPVMCSRARATQQRLARPISVIEADVLSRHLPDASADVVVSSFGLKTFSTEQQAQLAQTLNRVLKPGGRFAFIEISVPPWAVLRWPYLLYLRHVIPLIGRMMLGNPECYRMLSVYTEAFGNAKQFADACQRCGLTANYHSHFFGCASAVSGYKGELGAELSRQA